MRAPLRKPAVLYSIYGAAISLLAAVYFGSLGDHLLETHDEETFRDNAVIAVDFSFFFSLEKEQAAGRFTGEFAKWLISLFAGEDPRLFHFTNVAVHALVSFVLLFAYRSTGFSPAISALGGLLFLVNVAHFQAVHWITQLDYLLGLLCALLAILFFTRFLDTGRHGWIAPALLSALLAIGAHAGLFVLFPVALYWAARGRFTGLQILKWLLGIGSASAGIVVFILSKTARDTPAWDVVRTLGSVGNFAVLAQSLENLGLYLSRLLTTAHWILVPLYESHPWEPYLGLAFGLLLALGLYKKHERGVDIWIIWTLLTLIPFSPILPTGLFQSPTGLSRYLYFATAGSSLLLACLLERVAHLLPDRFRAYETAFAAVLFVPLALSSYAALKQTETLSVFSSARYYIGSGDTEKGIERLYAVLAGNTSAVPLAEVYFHLAGLLPSRARDPGPVLREGLAVFPDDLWLNLVSGLIDQEGDDELTRHRGRQRLQVTFERAEHHAHAGLLPINVAAILHNMGIGYALEANYLRAIRTFERVLMIKPDKQNTLRSLGHAYVSLGHQHYEQSRFDKALESYDKALELNPDEAVVHISLGWFFYYQSRWQKAITHHRTALELQPDIHAQFALGLAYLANGDSSAARAVYEQGIRQFGPEAAFKIGAVRNLDELIENNQEAEFARSIRTTYWP